MVDVVAARDLARRLRADPDKIEYVCRAALMLFEIENVGKEECEACPVCFLPDAYNKGHLWQCDLRGALVTMREYTNGS